MSTPTELSHMRDSVTIFASDATEQNFLPAKARLVDAILFEIADILQVFIETGEGGIVDIRSLPMSDEDKAELSERLGIGEVSIQLKVAGFSEIYETSIPGVWWIRHEGSEGKISSELIEVTLIPDIVVAVREEVTIGLEKLRQNLVPESGGAL